MVSWVEGGRAVRPYLDPPVRISDAQHRLGLQSNKHDRAKYVAWIQVESVYTIYTGNEAKVFKTKTRLRRPIPRP